MTALHSSLRLGLAYYEDNAGDQGRVSTKRMYTITNIRGRFNIIVLTTEKAV
jgi:hypothetical protein